ncbi:MAG: 3-deoxy-manno-octulosonate-8-phosphatase KdsC [Thiohalophilus sp.]|uniref:3-deoxy-manno-octulosonate-8-phosphatase KdsC n=1 Tax=Thiohalophilus sp. TaxID=3028392 RepID=UPI00287058DB|nr:3-deoxy-manno-octulosonate-8-phosphatase KdsC [Thiohalophilus sp.]MDR9436573.1 3-deoxy-manno-octulosonate-8-phosphatase KdsC [Thiohalophilus sp.]
MKDILARAAQIKLVVFDVDGVLTDGTLFVGDDGQEYKAFHSRDGFGIKLLRQSGVQIGVITARNSQVVLHRMENLGIEHVYQNRLEKLPAFEELVAKLELQPEQAAYVGDDVVDLPVMRRAGLAIAVQDAHPLAKQHAHWQTPHGGGRGAARDVCELIMEAQETLDEQLSKYLHE